MQSSSILRKHVTFLAIAGILLVVACSVYAAQGNPYAPGSTSATAYTTPITNAYLLQDQMPESVYKYVVARVGDYMFVNNLSAASMRVSGGITSGTGTYDFTLNLEPQDQALRIDVSVRNTSGFISSSVNVDGQLQVPYIPGSTSVVGNYTSFSGFGGLVDKGLAAIQANELGRALVHFAPTAGSFVIDSNSIATYLPAAGQADGGMAYTFSVKVDDKAYDAKLTVTGLYQSRLFLTDPQTHKQVYDSGALDQGA